jgi:benzoate membrane transport protein
MLNASGPPAHRYVGAIWLGLFFLTFGIMAPTAVALALAIPQTMIGVMAGLAMIAVLQSAFTAAFAGRFATGAVVAFLVTVSGVSIFNIGAAFWGLVFGLAVSRIVEPGDFSDSHKR